MEPLDRQLLIPHIHLDRVEEWIELTHGSAVPERVEWLNRRWHQQLNGMQRCVVAISVDPAWKVESIQDSTLNSADALIEAGALPCLLLRGPSELELLNQAGAVILPGGKDIDPSTYGQPPAGTKMDQVNGGFDRHQIELAARLLERGVPIVAVCRGAQILNIAGGGTLFQDVQEGAETRPERVGRSTLRTFVEHESEKLPSQPLIVQPDCRLHAIVGGSALVNSIHHQAIDRLAPTFVGVAHGDDGVVEAFERRGVPQQCGYQFHPEVQRRTDPRLQKLYDLLVQDAILYLGPSKQ